jgi:hypothetical protein
MYCINNSMQKMQLTHLDIFAFVNFVDMPGNGAVCANAVLLHQRDQFRLGQVFRRIGHSLDKLHTAEDK